MWKAGIDNGIPGLDLKKILKKMHAKWAEYKDSTSLTNYSMDFKKENGETTTFKYSNHEEFFTDVSFCIFAFVSRGPRWDKVVDRSHQVFKDVINMLRFKFDILVVPSPTLRNGPALQSDTVTPFRIAACFPQLVCEHFHKGRGKTLVEFQDIGMPPQKKEKEKPSKAILSLSFPSMISKKLTEKCRDIHLLSFLCYLKMDKFFHDTEGTEMTPLKNMLAFYKAAYTIEVSPDNSREMFLEYMGIFDGSKLDEKYAEALLGVVDLLKGTRPGNEMDSTIESLRKLT